MSTATEIAKWLETLLAEGAERLEGADGYEQPWPANLRMIISKVRSWDLAFPDGSTEADRDRILLRYVLENGSVHATRLPGQGKSLSPHWQAWDLVGRGHLRTWDRLAEHVELTASGHRRLYEVDSTYTMPPHTVRELELWSDIEALEARAAHLRAQRRSGVQESG